MKLYYSTASPYARTAQVTLREVGLDPVKCEKETHPFNNEDDFIAANPLGKVPCLVLDTGESLYDSEVICQYLDEVYNEGALWQPIKENWQFRKLYSQVSGLLDISVALRQEKMRDDEGVKSEFWWERFNSALDRGLKDLAQSATGFPKEFNLLHINSICLLDYVTFRHPEISWNNLEALSELHATYSVRASFSDTKPRG